LTPSPTMPTGRRRRAARPALLVLRQQVGMHLVDAELPRDGAGGRRVVAGQHHRPHAQALQLLDRLPAGLPGRVGDGEEGQHPLAIGQQRDRPPLRFMPCSCASSARSTGPARGSSGGCEHIGVAGDGPVHATAGLGPNDSTGSASPPTPLATALDTGWSEVPPGCARCEGSGPPAACRSTGRVDHFGLPSVSVPVLSSATTLSRRAPSR
jgi:hypothetical protein